MRSIIGIGQFCIYALSSALCRLIFLHVVSRILCAASDVVDW